MRKKIKINVKPEIAWGIIGTMSIILIYAVVSGSLNMPEILKAQIGKSKKSSSEKTINEARVLFATNGKKEIYKVQKEDGKWAVIIDGRESAAYDSVDDGVFSQDGERFAFSGRNGDETVVVVDGQAEEQAFRDIVEIVFSQDGGKIAYVAVGNDGKSAVVVNGQTGKAYEQINSLETSGGSSYIIFSPNGESIAYKVTVDGKSFIVVNGQEGKAYADIISFTFSPDGSQFAYTAIDENGRQVTVVNNQEIPDTGPAASSGNSETDSSGSSGSSSSGSSSGKYKGNRFKNDVHWDESGVFYPICAGDSCNF